MAKKKKQIFGGRKKKITKPPPLELIPELVADAELVKRYLNVHFFTPMSELKRKAKDPSVAFAERSIIAVMLKIEKNGDIYALNALYDRLIGPVLRRLAITGERPFESWSTEELLAEKEKYRAANEHEIKMIHKEKMLVRAVESGNYDRDKCTIIDVNAETTFKTGSD